MNILLPWNLSYFMPLNGFHPLYRGVLGYKGDHRLIVPKHDLSYGQYQYLSKQGLYSNKIDDDLWWLKDLENDLKNRFYDFFSKREINFASYLPGDIEFLHTAPITKGERPFVVHLESFLPFFMPFSFQGESGIAQTLLKVRGNYKNLLLKNCVAIVSHSKYTLKELSHFFNEPKIDELLKHVPIGVPYEPINTITKPPKTTFLFVASAHQNINNFVYKGGMVAISSALKLLELYADKYQFIFRTKRPPDKSFTPYGIDIKNLKEFENNGTIIWLESNITELGLKRLFAKSDFLFLASASLHSDAVLRAMMYGTIPIVTDIDAYKIYLNPEISIEITGVKNCIMKSDTVEGTTIIYDDYESYHGLHTSMVNQLISKVLDINIDKKKKMSIKLIEKFKENFEQERMIPPLFDIFSQIKLSEKNLISEGNNIENKLFLGEDYIEDLSLHWYDTISNAMILYFTGFGWMRKIFHLYAFLLPRDEKNMGNSDNLSHLNLTEQKYSKPITKRVETFSNSQESISYLHQIVDPSNARFTYMTSNNLGLAKADCPYCNSELSGLNKKYYFIKKKLVNYLKILPVLYIFSKCSVNCLKNEVKNRILSNQEKFKVDSKIPTLISSINNYNIVKYQNKYYAIPRELGAIDVEYDDISKHKDILTSNRFSALKKEIVKKRIKTQEIKVDSKIPILVSSIDNYNIVKYQNKYYAIPHELGAIDVEYDDISKHKDILTNNRFNILEKEIIRKRTIIKTIKINIHKLLNRGEYKHENKPSGF